MRGLYTGDRPAWGHGGRQHQGAGDLLHARLVDRPCFCPFSRRARMLVVVARGEGGFGAAALQVDPGRVQWAAGQCRTTQRQRGLRTRHRTTRTRCYRAQLPALRVVITQIAGTRVVSQTTPTSTRRPRSVPSPSASSLGPCEDCLGHSIAFWATAAPCTCRSVGRNVPRP